MTGVHEPSVDREWLTRALRPAAPRGRILSVRERVRPAVHSRIRHLEIEWVGAPPGAPTRLVWKRPRHDDRESAIWELLRSVTAVPVPRCYAADGSGILLEDVSSTYEPPVSRADLLAGCGVPGPGRVESVVDALADLHAVFWEHRALGAGELAVRDWFRDGPAHARHVARRRSEWARFLDREPRTPFRDVYEPALEVLEALGTREWEQRMASLRHVTLVQGDAYLNQFRVPSSGDGPARILDFGDATANPGAWDLAFALATFWTGEQRLTGGREAKLLRRYARRLASHGVEFAAEDVMRDYRWMVAYLVFDPVWNCTDGSSREYWEPKMRCLTTAWRDLDCASLPG